MQDPDPLASTVDIVFPGIRHVWRDWGLSAVSAVTVQGEGAYLFNHLPVVRCFSRASAGAPQTAAPRRSFTARDENFACRRAAGGGNKFLPMVRREKCWKLRFVNL